MKNRGSLGYLTKEGFRNIYTNKLMSIASISVLFSCLVMIGSAFLVLENMRYMLEGIEKENVIVAFYYLDADGAPGDELGRQIEALDNVDTVEFFSKEDAWAQRLENDPLKTDLEGEENPLPDSYKVTVANMDKYGQTLNDIDELEGTDEVYGNVGTAETLDDINDIVSKISISFILMLLAVSLFIISNTIRITMFNRRLEISIMRSVGATSWFIRWPFMLEGMILGLIAGLLAVLAVWGIYEWAVIPLVNTLQYVIGRGSLPFSHYAAIILIFFTGIGIIAGGLGSAFSITKYLKEKEFVDFEE